MIGKIIAYELKKRIFSPISLLLLAIMIFQGIWYTKGGYEMYQSAGVYANSAASFYQNLAGGGMLLVIIVAMFTTATIYKDHQHGTAHWLFAYPMGDKSFFVGRFITAYLYNAFLGIGYCVGLLLTPYSGIAPPEAFGPMPVTQIFHGYFCLLLPNLFLMTAMIFAFVIRFKTAISGYAAMIILVIIFLVMVVSSEVQVNLFQLLADPFGYVPVRHWISYLDDATKNTMFLHFEGYLLWNKLGWFGIALLLFLMSCYKFSFISFYQKKVKHKKDKPLMDTTSVPLKVKKASPSLCFNGFSNFKKMLGLVWVNYLNIVRPRSFKLILGLILLMVAMQNLLYNATYYIGPQQPITSNYTLSRLTLGVMLMILLMVWSGELFFKSKIYRIKPILDAMPLPLWCQKIAQLISCYLLAFTLPLFFILLGIGSQIIQGGIRSIDIGQYLHHMMGYQWGWLTYVLMISVTFFIAGITNHRFATHILSVFFLMTTILSFEFGLAENLRYGYGLPPGVEDFSEMNGYGIFNKANFWYFLMWLSLALFLVFMGVLFFNRGLKSWRQKFSFRNKQLNIGGKIVAMLFLGGFFYLQFFIKEQTIGKGNFVPTSVEEADKTHYEKKYAYLKTKNFPKYKGIKGTFHFFPNERKVAFKTYLTLLNTGDTTIDSLYLKLPDFVRFSEITVNGQALKKVIDDKRHSTSVYLFRKLMQAGDTLVCVVKGTKAYSGISQAALQQDIIANGSFGSIWDFLPLIGYDAENILSNNRARRENGLSDLAAKMPLFTNEQAAKQLFKNPDALSLSVDVTVSTTKGQTPFASGKKILTQKKQNRMFTRFIANTNDPSKVYLGSAKYVAVAGQVGTIKTNFYYDTRHNYNIDFFKKLLQKVFAFYQNNIDATYPFDTFNLYEIPSYGADFYSFSNGIALSENQGWFADLSGKKEQAYVYLSFASAIFQHWIQSNIKIANVQGADNLRTGLADAFGLCFLAAHFDKKWVEYILEKKKDQYIRLKNEDFAQSPDWKIVDETDYIATNKSSVELYKLLMIKGGKKAIKNWIAILKNLPQPVVFNDFFKEIK